MVARYEKGGSGSRLIAEIKHYGNRLRYTSILVDSLTHVVPFYFLQKFRKCDFQKYLGNTYCYFIKYTDTVSMQCVLTNYLRDRKSPWIWPKNYPECADARDMRKDLEKAIEEKWDE
jgi:hypothetical protein